MIYRIKQYLFVGVLLLSLFSSCTTDQDNELKSGSAGTISMLINTEKASNEMNRQVLSDVSTRAHEALIEEVKINNLQVFFFDSTNGDLLWKPLESEISYNKSGLLTLVVPSLDIRRDISKDRVNLYVVANSKSLDMQREVDLLAHQVTDARFIENEQPSEFLMIGKESPIIEFVGNNSQLEPIVLERLAVKIETIYPRIPAFGIESVNENNEKIYYFLSGPDAVSVSLVGINTESYLGNYLNTEDFQSSNFQPIEKGSMVHFYSFARAWSDSLDGTYLFYRIRLMRSDTSTESYYYYKVSVNGDAESNASSYLSIERNHHYLVFPKIETLGETYAEKPVELTSQFAVFDWTMKRLEASIVQAHYFMIRETEVKMSNIKEYRIKFASSSKVKYKGLRDAWHWTWVKVNNHSEDLKAVKENLSSEYKPRVQVKNDSKNKEIIITAKVPEDFSPHYFTLQFEDDNGFTESVSVEQYPARFITGKRSEEKDKDPFVYYAHDRGNNSSLASQNNFNLFTITTLAGGEEFNGKKYRIGDPSYRSEGKMYTHEDAEHNQLISPRFVIASHRSIYYRTMYNRGYQGNGIGYVLSARERCANYAEGGYGVGTWRLPTEAEIEYIASIQNSDQSPVKNLFDGAMYWSGATYRYYIFKRITSYDGNVGLFGDYRDGDQNYQNDGYYIRGNQGLVPIGNNASEANYRGFVDESGVYPNYNMSSRFYYSSYVRCVRDI